jgi:hypothetical protein
VLQNGRVVFNGTAREGIQYYLHNLSGEGCEAGAHIMDLAAAKGRPGKYQPQLDRLELYTEGDTPLTGDLPVGAPLKAVISFHLKERCMSFDASMAFDTVTGQRVCTAHSAYEPDRVHEPKVGEQVFVCEIASLPLVPGDYKIHVGLDIGGHEVDWVENAASMTVIRSDYYGTGVVPTKGAFLLKNRWMLEHQATGVGA